MRSFLLNAHKVLFEEFHRGLLPARFCFKNTENLQNAEVHRGEQSKPMILKFKLWKTDQVYKVWVMIASPDGRQNEQNWLRFDLKPPIRQNVPAKLKNSARCLLGSFKHICYFYEHFTQEVGRARLVFGCSR